MIFRFTLLLLTVFLLAAASPLQQVAYRARNPELGIVYNPVRWDRQQWEEIFRDPAPPAAWAIMPVGRESCSALTSWWLAGVRRQKLRPALLMDPFLTKNEIEKTIDCAVPLGVRRIILDEYISYHSKNLKRNLCTVITEARQIYENAKRKYPTLELGLNDNWHTWMIDLSQGQAGKSCGAYPYFQYDKTGISVLSKYGNPATGQCGHPTIEEMREQLLDADRTVRDYSKSRKIFLWQLNQHWYPGEGEVLQLFREARKIYGWNRFFLFGPTTDEHSYGNWGYRQQAMREGCFAGDYNWYLPARDYLIRLAEGKQPVISLSLPSVANRGSTISLNGRVVTGGDGIPVQGMQLQITPPLDSVQRFQRDLIAPQKARLALVGVRVNLQLPHKIIGPAKFHLDRVQFSRKDSSTNYVLNPDFNNGLKDWLILSTGSVTAESTGTENYLSATSSANQSISITSVPIFVTPGRSYTVRFDARILQEARNNAYFFVSWYTTSEVRRDRIFMKFPEPRTIATTNSDSAGHFLFQWQPSDAGIYSVAAFYPGSPAYQPAIRTGRIQVN